MHKYFFGIILIIIGLPLLLLPFAPGSILIITGLGYIGISFGKDSRKESIDKRK